MGIYTPFGYRTINKGIVTSGLQLYLDAGIAASYPGSGTTWFDLSGNGRNRTLVGGITYSTLNGGALVFNGSTGRLDNITLPNPNNQMTYEIVMNYTATNAFHNLIDRVNTLNPMIWFQPSNRIEINEARLVSDVSYAGNIVVITVTMTSASSPYINLYVNGAFAKSTTTVTPSWPNPSTFTLFNRGGSQTYNGTVYSVKIYDRILTTSEITQNYNTFRNRFGL